MCGFNEITAIALCKKIRVLVFTSEGESFGWNRNSVNLPKVQLYYNTAVKHYDIVKGVVTDAIIFQMENGAVACKKDARRGGGRSSRPSKTEKKRKDRQKETKKKLEPGPKTSNC